MNWTKTLPTEAGYYWWRKNQHKAESIYYVAYDMDKSIANELKDGPVSRYTFNCQY